MKNYDYEVAFDRVTPKQLQKTEQLRSGSPGAEFLGVEVTSAPEFCGTGTEIWFRRTFVGSAALIKILRKS